MKRGQYAIVGFLGCMVVCVLTALATLMLVTTPLKPQVVYIEVTSTPANTELGFSTGGTPMTTQKSTPLPIPTIQLATPTVESAPEIVVKDHQCRVSELDIMCLVTVTNVGSVVTNASFDFNIFDPKDISIGGFYGDANSVFPGEMRKVFVQNSLKEGTTFGRYTLSASTSHIFVTGNYFSVNPLSASNIEYKLGSFIYDDVIALVSNASDKTIDGVELFAILYDKNGAFVGGGDGFIPILPPRGQARAQIYVQKIGTVSRVEAYPSFANITTIK